MATPFTVFRNYSGILMATLCALLMIAFVVADPLTQYLGGGSSSDGGNTARARETVVSWDGGSLNERQLADLVLHRRLLAEFQRSVYTTGAAKAQGAGVTDLSLATLRVRPLELPESYEQGVERDVVRTKLLAERARKSGIVVSDEAILDYLRGLGRDRVSSDEMRSMLTRMSVGGRRATIEFIFNLLRDAILQKNYLTSHQFSFATVLPAERWDDWRKVNERIVLEVAPIAVEKYLDKAPEPSDAEVEALFEEYKNRAPSPDLLSAYGNVELASPLPAFATPAQVKLQYVVAEFDDFVNRVADEVTEEEVVAFYKENRESFIKADQALFGADDAESEESESDAADPADAVSDEATEESPPRSDEPAATTEEAMTADSPAAEGTPDSADDSEDDRNPLRDGDSAEAVEEEEEEEEAASDTPAATEGDAPNDDEYQTLEEVRPEILKRIAEQKAAERLQKFVDGLYRELDDLRGEYFDAALDAEDAGKEAPAPPAALADLAPLAKEHGLKLVTTDALSMLDLRGETFGRSVNADDTAPQALPLWIMAFREGGLDLYDPLVTYDLDGNRYLSVITTRTDRVVPKLADVREEVVAAWKRDKAAEMALAEAKKLAEAAQGAGKSLSEHFADDDQINATETDPFSFLTIGNVSPTTGDVSLRLSQPEPLASPGPDLLAKAFDLGAGDVAAALNHDRSIVYMMRVAQRLGTSEELRGEFQRDGSRWFGMPAMLRDRVRRAATTLVSDLEAEANVEWLRTPDSPGESG
ncbi:MAG: hypothetical protein ACRCT8_11280 [Lacipirellulaceae bacterium]